MTTRPSFFIIGAPKSGTTALHHYLRSHPAVFMPALKEPHFFASDFRDKTRVTDLESYQALFAKAPPGTVCGEASVWYLYSTEAVRAILDYQPDAKLIAMLRDPASMVPSMHNQALFSFVEDVEDFETAWRLEDARSRGEHMPKRHQGVEFLRYRRIALYAEQLSRVYEYAPQEQVKVLLYDDFRRDPARIYSEVIDFLDLSHDGRSEFPPVNEAKKAWAPKLTELIAHPPAPILPVKRAIKKMSGLTKGEIGRFVRKVNRRSQAVAPVPAELTREIQAAYSQDVEALEALIQRDLSAWRPS